MVGGCSISETLSYNLAVAFLKINTAFWIKINEDVCEQAAHNLYIFQALLPADISAFSLFFF
jgi:hypothetical protein